MLKGGVGLGGWGLAYEGGGGLGGRGSGVTRRRRPAVRQRRRKPGRAVRFKDSKYPYLFMVLRGGNPAGLSASCIVRA